MKKINIYLYWYGDEEIKELIKQKFDKLKLLYKNVNYTIGPSKEEHELLLQKCKFYKYNFENKRYAFCSDFYRTWKLSENNGLYIDVMSEINYDRFSEFIELVNDNESIFIKENGHLVWNGIFYSENKDLLKRITLFYEKHYKVASRLTGPLIYSMFIYNEYGINMNKSKNTLFLDARDIDPYSKESFFNYNGLGSWGKNKKIDINEREKTGAHHYFHKNAKKFENGFSSLWSIIRFFLKHKMIIYSFIRL